MKQIILSLICLGALVGCGGVLPVDVSSLSLVPSRALSLGHLQSCAVTSSGSVYCWGENGEKQSQSKGMLMQGSTANIGDSAGEMQNIVASQFGMTVQSLSVNQENGCALSTEGRVKCWGYALQKIVAEFPNLATFAGLFIGDDASSIGTALPYADFGSAYPQMKAVSVGGTFACAVTSGGDVVCWGNNQYGQLGQGSTAYPSANALPITDLLESTKKLAVGYTQACALSESGNVRCWGVNTFTAGSLTVYAGACGTGDANNYGSGVNQMGSHLPVVNLGTGETAVDIATRDATTCALLADGKVKCWGDNESGQLGLGDTAYRGYSAATIGDNLPPVDLGTGRTAIQIAVGELFVCALLDNHQVKCWGDNTYGELGQGDTNGRGDQLGEMGDALPAVDLGSDFVVESIAAGAYHACALSTDGKVKCWGRNNSGQLGLGDTVNRGTAPGQMGSALPVVALRPLN